MDFNEGIDHLKQLCKDKNWFASAELDKYGRYVVYTHYMNMDTMTYIPDNLEGKQVVVHYLSSKVPELVKLPEQEQDLVSEIIGDDTEDEDKSLTKLIGELDRLEKQCGSNTLQDIFYETHDLQNAVTNMSARYPDVRKTMDHLYDQYGFDIIYEQLDG